MYLLFDIRYLGTWQSDSSSVSSGASAFARNATALSFCNIVLSGKREEIFMGIVLKKTLKP